jgi:hypothetical protein
LIAATHCGNIPFAKIAFDAPAAGSRGRCHLIGGAASRRPPFWVRETRTLRFGVMTDGDGRTLLNFAKRTREQRAAARELIDR